MRDDQDTLIKQCREAAMAIKEAIEARTDKIKEVVVNEDDDGITLRIRLNPNVANRKGISLRLDFNEVRSLNRP